MHDVSIKYFASTALAASAASVGAPAATVFLQAVDSKNGKNIDTPIGSVVITVLAAADPFASAVDPVVSVVVAVVSPVLSSITAIFATVTTALVSLLLLDMKSLRCHSCCSCRHTIERITCW